MLLKAFKIALKWEDDSDFMPYYAQEKKHNSQSHASKSENKVKAKRQKTIEALHRLRAALDSSEGSKNGDKIMKKNDSQDFVENAIGRSAHPNAQPLPDQPKKKLSTREELLRRRGTSLASACQLLDNCYHSHYSSSDSSHNSLKCKFS